MVARGYESECRRERLTAGGPAIGLMPGVEYAAGRVVLEPGDLLAAFTDGISEALNADGDEWGEERMLALIARSAHRRARDCRDRAGRRR